MRAAYQVTRMVNALRDARERAGISQAALGRKIGVSASTIADIERGARTNPHIETLASIAHALGLNIVVASAKTSEGGEP